MSDKNIIRKPTPDEILDSVMRGEAKAKRGYHKVFIGFAAGVGKTFEMLTEANRRRQRGEDVVVGFVETHGRVGTAEQIGGLEVIPRKKMDYRGTAFEEMDTDAIIERHPELVLVDELAHTNVPGSAREKRWQDVEILLSAGIGVLSTMNVQHLESLNDTVHDITGIWVRETVPDHVLREVDEIMMIDIPPRALINRLERGDVYPKDKVDQAMRNWFREGNLNALREIALREIAHEVDENLTTYRKEKHISEVWNAHDRVMVCISPTHNSMRLIRRGWRTAQRHKGDVVGVYVETSPPGEKEQAILKNDFALADRLGVPIVTLHGDVGEELIRYARENDVTQIVMGTSGRSRWREMWRGSLVNSITRELPKVDVLIVGATDDAV